MMAKAMTSRKQSKTLKEEPQGSLPGAWDPESDARLQAFMDQAIGGQNDAYLKKLAMTVVQLQAMSEITALQSDLLKEKAEITRETKSISDSKVQIAQAKRRLTLENKKIAEVQESLLKAEKAVDRRMKKVSALSLFLKGTAK